MRQTKFEDLIGREFTYLTVLSKAPSRYHGTDPLLKLYWVCQCRCGKVYEVMGAKLRSGNTKSCGCRAKANRLITNTKHGHSRAINGASTPEYVSWHSMKTRCYNTKVKEYPRYGGRGIKVCDRWLGPNGFANFLADMGPMPKGYRNGIDRYPNNDGNYEPSNCRWATPKQQANNRRNNKHN